MTVIEYTRRLECVEAIAVSLETTDAHNRAVSIYWRLLRRLNEARVTMDPCRASHYPLPGDGTPELGREYQPLWYNESLSSQKPSSSFIQHP